jgi:hypothetical protein
LNTAESLKGEGEEVRRQRPEEGPGGHKGNESRSKDIVDSEDDDTNGVDVVERHGGHWLAHLSAGTVH